MKLDDASGPSKPSAADEESIGSVSEDEEEVRHNSVGPSQPGSIPHEGGRGDVEHSYSEEAA